MTEAQRDLPDYRTPPLIEVVFGVKFTPLPKWRIPHIGAFWQLVAQEYGKCEHAPPFGDSSFTDPTTGIPLPRVWLLNATDDKLIQMQQGRFLFNWRRRPTAAKYPRYQSLVEEYFKLLETFEKFTSEKELGELSWEQFELTYLNHIPQPEGWSFPTDFERVIDRVRWQPGGSLLRHPFAMGWQATFPFGEKTGTLQVKVNPAKQTESQQELILLELVARGLPAAAPRDNMRDWFDRAHEWIVRGFAELTSEEAQRDLWVKHA